MKVLKFPMTMTYLAQRFPYKKRQKHPQSLTLGRKFSQKTEIFRKLDQTIAHSKFAL